MPELPEVETIRKTLRSCLVGRRVDEAVFRREDIIEMPDDALQQAGGDVCGAAESFSEGSVIREVGRRGKYMLLRFASGGGWAVHFGMSGSMCRADNEDPADKHTHVIWQLDDGVQIRYRAPRRFGRWIMTAEDPACWLNPRLGVDALDECLDQERFRQILRGSRRRIKSRLLDQSLIAGVGNIYADELLFRAGIHPARRINSLSDDDWQNLYKATQAVLSEAIKHCGTTFDSFRDGYGQPGANEVNLKVYGREEQQCLRCCESIRKIRLEGRGTHFCPGCQPEESES